MKENDIQRVEERLEELGRICKKDGTSIDISGQVLARIHAGEREKAGFPDLMAWLKAHLTLPSAVLAVILCLAIPVIFYSVSQAKYKKVTFTYSSPGAEKVSISGDFTEWRPERMEYDPDRKEWSIEIKLEKFKRFKYVFILNDGKYIPDPRAGSMVDDGFGGRDSVISTI
ncbi:MAG: hypothetical protein PHF84_11530 [bacterium]|nr:hypothetical protein [bacterium]